MGWALGSEGSLPQLQTPLLPPHQLKPQHQVGQSVLRDQGAGRELGPLGSGETEAPGAPPPAVRTGQARTQTLTMTLYDGK